VEGKKKSPTGRENLKMKEKLQRKGGLLISKPTMPLKHCGRQPKKPKGWFHKDHGEPRKGRINQKPSEKGEYSNKGRILPPEKETKKGL